MKSKQRASTPLPVIALLAALGLTGCGGSGDSHDAAPATPAPAPSTPAAPALSAQVAARTHYFGAENVDQKTGDIRKDLVVM